MVLREKTVQIDYGKERFADLEHFNKWFVQLPSDILVQTKDLQQILVEDNIPIAAALLSIRVQETHMLL